MTIIVVAFRFGGNVPCDKNWLGGIQGHRNVRFGNAPCQMVMLFGPDHGAEDL